MTRRPRRRRGPHRFGGRVRPICYRSIQFTSRAANAREPTGGTVLEDPEGKLVLSITGSKQLFLGTTPVKWSELEDKLALNERVRREKELWIEADSTLPYGVVVAAMAMARQAGVAKLQMLTDPSEVMAPEDLDAQAAAAGTAAPAAAPE